MSPDQMQPEPIPVGEATETTWAEWLRALEDWA